MDNVAMAVERDFYEWHSRSGEGDRKKRDTLTDMMAVYLKEKFDIKEGDPTILEIIQSTTSLGGASALVAEALTKNAKRCKVKEQEQEKESEGESAPENQPGTSRFKIMGEKQYDSRNRVQCLC